MTSITYSRWDRIHFRLFGRWPQRVVDRRLAALAVDEHNMRVEASRQRLVQILEQMKADL